MVVGRRGLVVIVGTAGTTAVVVGTTGTSGVVVDDRTAVVTARVPVAATVELYGEERSSERCSTTRHQSPADSSDGYVQGLNDNGGSKGIGRLTDDDSVAIDPRQSRRVDLGKRG